MRRGILETGAPPRAVDQFGDYPAMFRALIENRRGTRFTHQQADQAILSFEQPDDRARVGGWIQRFLAEATLGRP